MAGIQSILQAARAMGDKSSLEKGVPGKRIRRRVVGGAAGKKMASLSVFGLIMWAQFFAWLRNAIEQAAAQDVWLGTVINYAAGYELGFTNPQGMRKMRPYFFTGIREARKSRFGGHTAAKVSAPDRSGLYVGNRFAADIRSIAKGRTHARIARRAAGSETTKLFWGTLADPDKNVLEVLAKDSIREIQKNIRDQKLIETGALLNSIAFGSDLGEMQRRSMAGALDALIEADRTDELADKTL